MNREDFGRCVSEDSWPQGWKIRKFFRNFKIKSDNKASESGSSVQKSFSQEKGQDTSQNKEKVKNGGKVLANEKSELERLLNEESFNCSKSELEERMKKYKEVDWSKYEVTG